MKKEGTAIIIGAGPAGLTAAHELLERTAIRPIVLERSDYVGGIARTVRYKGNRIDIGGHRFFSKSDRVMRWWLDILPLQKLDGDEPIEITYQRSSRPLDGEAAEGPDPETSDRVMLVRERKSRIYYLRQFFDYPISLSFDTLRKLGLVRTVKIVFSYARSLLFPIRQPSNLEEFFINRFGRELYLTFFKSYTEKVWGTSCREISAEWGAQRIKGLSITRAVLHFVKGLLPRRRDLAQKGTETSLIEQFLYPKFGPGQMWEEVAARVTERGGEVRMRHEVVRLLGEGTRIRGVVVRDRDTGVEQTLEGDYVFSTMAIRDLIRGLEGGTGEGDAGEDDAGEGDGAVPGDIERISEGLVYRDFLTVGLLVERLAITSRDGGLITDNWIYIQEPDVRVGRLQIFNNWSPYMVADPDKVWIGLEYFVDEGDDLWCKDDDELIAFGAEELDHIGLIEKKHVIDGVVIRMPKTYPAYFGTYDEFPELQRFLDRFENLFPVGRNGMHKYNNQDHSMLAAMTAVDNIVEGRTDKSNLWQVNTEEEYHEEVGSAENDSGV